MQFIRCNEDGIPNQGTFQAVAGALNRRKLLPAVLIPAHKAARCTELSLLREGITDLDFLAFFPALTQLYVSSKDLSDISGLRHVPKLRKLDLVNHSLRDLTPVMECPELTSLTVCTLDGYTAPHDLGDLSFLTGLGQLRELCLGGMGLREVPWLTGLPALTNLSLFDNPGLDIAPVAALRELLEIELSGCGITDLTPLTGLEKLETLCLSDALEDWSVALTMPRLREALINKKAISSEEQRRQIKEHLKKNRR